MAKQEKKEKLFDWEASRVDRIERSEKRAWKVAGAFGVCFGLSVVGMVLMLPLKQTVPYVIRVNTTTGSIDAMTAVRAQDMKFDEVLDKHWVANYVKARETYDWHTVENDYLLTQELSEKNVFIPVADLYKSPTSPTKVYTDKKRVNVAISSITLSGTSAPVATVRLTKSVIDNDSNSVLSTTSWVATVAYEYAPSPLATENTRLLNPFGFKVTSYRIDPEVSNLNAPAAPAAAAAAGGES